MKSEWVVRWWNPRDDIPDGWKKADQIEGQHHDHYGFLIEQEDGAPIEGYDPQHEG